MISFLKRALALSAVLVVFAASAHAEISYEFVDAETVDFDDGGEIVTGVWNDDEKAKVARYFEMAESASSSISRLLAKGEEKHGPIRVIKREPLKWSLGLAKRSKDRQTHYLVLNSHFFKGYDREFDLTGYEGGNFTFWFFVHELVHLAEFRSTFVGAFLPSLSPGGPVGPQLVAKIEEARTLLSERTISYDEYVYSTDWVNIDVIRDIGIPTKYSLRAPQELLAEVITAMTLAPSYEPPDDIRKITEYFFRE